MLLSIIIISFNTAQITLNAIKAVADNLNQSKLLSGKSEIIIVDNNSTDDSIRVIEDFFAKNQKQRFSQKLIKNKKNLGFSQANNQAIKIANGDMILLLNSDTVVQPGSLDTLIQSMLDHPINNSSAHLSSVKKPADRLGILASSLLNKDGSVQNQGGSRISLFSLFNQMFFIDDIPIFGKFLPTTQQNGANYQEQKSDKIIPKGWVGGTAMLIRREVIDEVGMLDESIFMYGEDMEYCMRAINHHWDVAIEPKSKTIHLGSASSGSENAILGEISGYLHIWSKHKPDWQMPIAKLIIYFGLLLRILVFSLVKSHQYKVKTYKKALNSL